MANSQNTVWKYILDDANSQRARIFGSSIVEAPEGSVFLSIEQQRNTAVLYLEVNPDADTRLYRLLNIGTGHPITVAPEARTFIGSVVMTRDGHEEKDNSVHHFWLVQELSEAVAMVVKQGIPSSGAEVIQVPQWIH